ncbi:ANTAR domain-containing protein [Streptomyces sp. NPDC001156]|jgi:hypothetical protein
MEHDRLQAENEQLERAVSSHAAVDQAIGALVVLGQIPPEDAWRALRDVSQRTNTKLRIVAENVLKFAQGSALPDTELIELRRALARYQAFSPANRDPQVAATGDGPPVDR